MLRSIDSLASSSLAKDQRLVRSKGVAPFEHPPIDAIGIHSDRDNKRVIAPFSSINGLSDISCKILSKNNSLHSCGLVVDIFLSLLFLGSPASASSSSDRRFASRRLRSDSGFLIRRHDAEPPPIAKREKTRFIAGYRR